MKNLQKQMVRVNISKNGWWFSLALLFILLISSSCGGGGGNPLLAGGGIGGTGVTSVGPITAFGSIWVNGVEYTTDGSSITVNGAAAGQLDLTRGMIVRVKGTINSDGVSGNAESVTFSRDIAGTVSAVDQANQTITILGQTVTWDNETFGDDDDSGRWIDAVPAVVGDYVEISGMPTQDGWLARAINHPAHAQENNNEISGVISNLDTMTHTFTINNLEIHYQGNMGATLQNGDYIEVSGNMQGYFFSASRLEMRNPELAGNNEDMKVEGIVRDYGSNKILTIMGSHGQYVIYANGSVFKNGTETDLHTGVRVEVSGYIQDSLFYAEEIEFKGKIEHK